ncbi:MAG: TolC family protein [Rikenellaceae bacterium]
MRNILKSSGLLLLSAVVLSSCVVKGYQSPKSDYSNQDLYQSVELGTDSIGVEAIAWDTFFGDTILQRYIKIVLDNNHDMLSAAKSIEIAYAQLRSSRASLAPTVGPASLAWGGLAQENQKFSSSLDLSLSTSWEVDIWGKLSSGKRAAQASLMASAEGVQALQTSLIAQMATAYYQLIALDMQRAVALQTIKNRQEYVDTVRLMKVAGRTNEVAVQQAVATLSTAQGYLPQIELSIIQTENTMVSLMGLATTNISRAKSIDYEALGSILEVGLPTQVLSRRPDVRASEQQYRAAFELYNVSRAAMYPSLNLSATGSVSDLLDAHTLSLSLLGGLTQPIFNGRALRTQKEVADLEQQQALISFQQTLLDAAIEVRNALASREKSWELVQAQSREFVAYRKAYEFSFDLFMSGYATYLDVLTAQTGVFDSELDLISCYLSNILAAIELYRAVGGGSDGIFGQAQVIDEARLSREAYQAEQKALRRSK